MQSGLDGKSASATSINGSVLATGTIHVSNSAELAAAVRNAKGGEIIAAAAGTYGPIALRDINPASNVTITSADPSARAVLTGLNLQDSSNITFRSVEFYDRDARTANDFNVKASANLVFDQIKLSSNDIAKGNPFLIRWSENVTISNSEFTDVRYAINLLNNDGVTIEKNYFHDIRGDGIRGGANSNIAIAYNYFTDFRPATGDHADAIQFWTSGTKARAHDIAITSNVIMRGDGGVMQGIFMNDEAGNLPYKSVLIQDNLVVGAMFNGIRLANGVDVKVIGNTVTGMPDQLSWISVPKTAVLQGNAAQHYTIGGVSIDSPANNETIAAARDGGDSLLSAWLDLHLGIDLSTLAANGTAATAAPAQASVTLAVAADDTAPAVAEENIGARSDEGDDLPYDPSLLSNLLGLLDGDSGDNGLEGARTSLSLIDGGILVESDIDGDRVVDLSIPLQALASLLAINAIA